MKTKRTNTVAYEKRINGADNGHLATQDTLSRRARGQGAGGPRDALSQSRLKKSKHSLVAVRLGSPSLSLFPFSFLFFSLLSFLIYTYPTGFRLHFLMSIHPVVSSTSSACSFSLPNVQSTNCMLRIRKTKPNDLFILSYGLSKKKISISLLITRELSMMHMT